MTEYYLITITSIIFLVHIFFSRVSYTYYIKIEEEFGTTPTTLVVHEAHNRHRTPPKHYDLTMRVQHPTLRPRAPQNGPATNDHDGCFEVDCPDDLHGGLQITTSTPLGR
jgi:hypothetical protein